MAQNSDPDARAIRPNRVVNSYAALQRQVRDAGLLNRRRRYYIALFTILATAWAGGWTGFALIGASWYQLLIAAGLGILMTQFGFLAHEAAHSQVFASWAANEWSARLIGNGLTGISYAMWQQKHSRHHSNPNVIGKDPDIKPGTIAFHDAAAAARPRWLGFITRHQGYLLFPILPFLGFALQVDSFRFLLRRAPVQRRAVELAILTGRVLAVPALAFWLLPPGIAAAFVGVQQGVFGFYMGATFAPNHKGMKIFSASARADFLTRQVMSSRNIRGGRIMDVLMGGLNHQIEHHLFPTMPRPALAHAESLIRAQCAQQGIPYTATSLVASYGIIIRYLNAVGYGLGTVFECPLATQHRPN
ncbi:fatty acid desaturase [Sinomonas atrocyanea]|uniref:fatty acid desaturase family protein n=1 Tax=Sinomonas atrocyanea TaxID=37927 RepID=UPI00277F4DEB|nr:acyl-CoA desaturase [Sinomonas atrocyanea]MDQ0258662.1 fatty acid desaturase [Sinomonas atrocyanea]